MKTNILHLLGGKYVPEIIVELNSNGTSRFKYLEEFIGTQPRTLSQILKKLEASKIVTRKAYAEVPPRTEYTLTEKGKQLLPIIALAERWGK